VGCPPFSWAASSALKDAHLVVSRVGRVFIKNKFKNNGPPSALGFRRWPRAARTPSGGPSNLALDRARVFARDVAARSFPSVRPVTSGQALSGPAPRILPDISLGRRSPPAMVTGLLGVPLVLVVAVPLFSCSAWEFFPFMPCLGGAVWLHGVVAVLLGGGPSCFCVGRPGRAGLFAAPGETLQGTVNRSAPGPHDGRRALPGGPSRWFCAQAVCRFVFNQRKKTKVMTGNK